MDVIRRLQYAVWKLEDAARRNPEAQGEKSIRPAGCQFVQPVMVCLNQTIVIEIVKVKAPDGLANRVEFPVNLLVGPPEVKTP